MKKFQKIAAIMLMTAMVFAAGCKHEDEDVKVTTHTPQNIKTTTAVCGGNVIAPQGLTLKKLGVCWSTDSMPTVEDSHLSTRNWREPYTCIITGLKPGTKYHVRAYALSGLEYYGDNQLEYYGDDKSFTTEDNGGVGHGSFNGHDYIDLGLPSGTLWATCNVGATKPGDYGDYFAWGETHTKAVYDWSTYQYCMSSQYGITNTLTKYCNMSDFGYNGFTDTLTILLPEDDAATASWGNGWRMPTKEEWQELLDNTINTWTTHGRLFIGPNGNTLFLPAAGARMGGGSASVDYMGVYLVSSLKTERPYTAHGIGFAEEGYGYNEGYNMSSFFRCDGISVRAVCSARQN